MEWAMLLFCFLIYLSGNTDLWLWLDLLPGDKMNTFSSIWELACGRSSVGLLLSVWVPNAFLYSSDQPHLSYTKARRLQSLNILGNDRVSYFTWFTFHSRWNQKFRYVSAVVIFMCYNTIKQTGVTYIGRNSTGSTGHRKNQRLSKTPPPLHQRKSARFRPVTEQREVATRRFPRDTFMSW